MKPSNAGRALAALRRTHSGGDTTVLRPCPYCKTQMGARVLRAHMPRCSSRPSVKAAAAAAQKLTAKADARKKKR